MVEKQLFNMKSYVSEGTDDEIQNEEIVSESNSDNSNNNSIHDQLPNGKRYHRHTPLQIQEMEAFFKDCPHPDNKQKKDLSHKLGMELLQVKFWFQNKRTQMKTQHERHENTQLRIENEKLRAENMRYREALSNASCSVCCGPTSTGDLSFEEHCLRIENARLREEIDCISTYADEPLMTPTANEAIDHLGCSMYITSQNKGDNLVITEVATIAMEELMRISQLGEPLWVPSIDLNTTLLNKEEYFRTFSRGFGPKLNGYKSEASRESGVVLMSPANVVEILMDVNEWSNVFSGVVSRAMNLQVVSFGDGRNYNGAIQVMNAEFHVPSPLVPIRESYFVRHCKQHVDGTWAVVDVSTDQVLHSTQQLKCRKRPSGCVIQAMLNGYSKVTWVEHVEVEDRDVPNIFKPLVNAGLAFGAKRWVAILDTQCQRLASHEFATHFSPGNFNYSFVANQEAGRKNMLKLADTMMANFCCGVSASNANTWTTLSADYDVKVMTRKKVDDSGGLLSIQLSAATSLWLPIPPKRVFDFLQDESSRNHEFLQHQWDKLSEGGDLQEMAHIVIGNELGNRISIYQVKDATSSQNKIILQETRTDPTASYVVYAPTDMVCLEVILGGGDPSFISLLPSGFAVLPDGPIGGTQGGGIRTQPDSGGSLLTIAFQVLVDPSPNSNLNPLGSVSAVKKLIICTVDRIKKALKS